MNFSANAAEQEIQNKTVFMECWKSNVVLPSKERCSDSLLLYPGALASPTYRNVYRRCAFVEVDREDIGRVKGQYTGYSIWVQYFTCEQLF